MLDACSSSILPCSFIVVSLSSFVIRASLCKRVICFLLGADGSSVCKLRLGWGPLIPPFCMISDVPALLA